MAADLQARNPLCSLRHGLSRLHHTWQADASSTLTTCRQTDRLILTRRFRSARCRSVRTASTPTPLETKRNEHQDEKKTKQKMLWCCVVCIWCDVKYGAGPAQPTSHHPTRIVTQVIKLTMTMTMTHSKKSIQQSSVAWPYRRERRGQDPAKRSLLKLMRLALLTKCALAHC